MQIDFPKICLGLRRRPMIGYAVALGLLVLAAAVRWGLGDALLGVPYLTVFPAIIIAALVGGLLPGLFAVAAGALLSWFYLIPTFTTSPPSSNLLSITFFVAVGSIICVLADAAMKGLEQAAVVAEQKSALLAEIHHRLKNQLQLISAMLSMQTRSIASAEAKDALRIAAQRVRTVAEIHARLFEETGKPVVLSYHLKALCDELMKTGGPAELTVDVDDGIQLDNDRILPLSLIVNELVVNSIKHAAGDGSGRIQLHLLRSGGLLRLSVDDDGPPLPSDIGQKHGLGLRLVTAFAQQLDGTVLIGTEGAKFTIEFPEASSR